MTRLSILYSDKATVYSVALESVIYTYIIHYRIASLLVEYVSPYSDTATAVGIYTYRYVVVRVFYLELRLSRAKVPQTQRLPPVPSSTGGR